MFWPEKTVLYNQIYLFVSLLFRIQTNTFISSIYVGICKAFHKWLSIDTTSYKSVYAIGFWGRSFFVRACIMYRVDFDFVARCCSMCTTHINRSHFETFAYICNTHTHPHREIGSIASKYMNMWDMLGIQKRFLHIKIDNELTVYCLIRFVVWLLWCRWTKLWDGRILVELALL